MWKNAPDLIFTTKDEKYLGCRTFAKYVLPTRVRSGTHKLNGVVLLSGSGMKKNSGTIPPAYYDVTPTILHILAFRYQRTWTEKCS